MKVRDCCVWCLKICTRPEGFDSKRNVLVCSAECLKSEQSFRIYFSDENIGLRNFQEFGINPNHRGKKS